MSILVMIGQLVLGLSLLVLVHEFGHYITAKMFGTRVDKFYIFGNPKISIARMKKINGKWRFAFFAKNTPDVYEEVKDEFGNVVKDAKGKPTYKEVDIAALPDSDWRKYPEHTEYGLGWLPFPIGGYCKIVGMVDESMDMEALKKDPQPWEFRSKPGWQRLIILLGGVIMNLITGIVIFSMLIFHNEQAYLSNKEIAKYGIYATQHAKELGFHDGDVIVAVNGKKIERFKDAQSINVLFGSTITVERKDGQFNIKIPDNAYKELKNSSMLFIEPFNFPLTIDSVIPDYPAATAGIQKGDDIIAFNDAVVATYGQFKELLWKNRGTTSVVQVVRGKDTLNKQLVIDSSGVAGFYAQMPYKNTEYTAFSSIYYGTKDAFSMISVNVKGIGKIFSGKEKASESLQGPIGIATIYGKIWNWARFWYITGLLSLILAFMNILPIPAVDGGHVVFTLWEMITGRKPSDKFMERAQLVGMAIIIALMVFAIGNDILRLFK